MINTLLSEWRLRLAVVQSDVRTIEPLLRLRRILLQQTQVTLTYTFILYTYMSYICIYLFRRGIYINVTIFAGAVRTDTRRNGEQVKGVHRKFLATERETCEKSRYFSTGIAIH